jgi:hypothetical protein
VRAVVVAGIAAAMVVASGPAGADGNESESGLSATSRAGHVAFWKAEAQRWELYVAGPGGTDARLVYRASISPAETCLGRVLEWSPDGTALLFCAPVATQRGATRIFMVRQDGSAVRCLTPLSRYEADPCWSPDGRMIAFLRCAAGDAPRDWSIWTMRADATGRERVPGEASVPFTSPSRPILRWSADGATLAWRAQPLYLGLAGR